MALDGLDVGRRYGQEGTHTVIGLDGGDVWHALYQEPGQDAGAGPDFENVGGTVG